jgi:hypothetical protein
MKNSITVKTEPAIAKARVQKVKRFRLFSK